MKEAVELFKLYYDTQALYLQDEQKTDPSDKEEWQTLSTEHLAAYKQQISQDKSIHSEVIGLYEVMPDVLVSRDLDHGQAFLRNWLIADNQTKNIHDPEYPFPIYNLFNKNFIYFPALIRSHQSLNSEGELITTTYFHKHPRLSDGVYWSYVNRISRDINRDVLIPSGQPPIPYYQVPHYPSEPRSDTIGPDK